MTVSLSKFLGAFYPDPDEAIWLLGFPAKKLPDGHPDKGGEFKLRISRNELISSRQIQDRLKQTNRHMGLYFVVNAGGTKKPEISRINAVFCEIDDLPMAEQHTIYNACALRPSILVETQKSVHAYWLTADSMSSAQFVSIQCSLIDRYHSDDKIKNENRVMRLPHFSHLKWDADYIRTPVKIHTFDESVRYTLKQLKEEFPARSRPQPIQFEQGFNDQTWEGIKQELRFRISQLPSYRIESNRTWGTAKGICHNGNNNTALTVNLRTGAISCKAGCDIDRIFSAFGLSKPVKKSFIEYVPARKQSGWLHDYVKANQIDADEREAIRREGCGEYREVMFSFDPREFETLEVAA